MKCTGFTLQTPLITPFLEQSTWAINEGDCLRSVPMPHRPLSSNNRLMMAESQMVPYSLCSALCRGNDAISNTPVTAHNILAPIGLWCNVMHHMGPFGSSHTVITVPSLSHILNKTKQKQSLSGQPTLHNNMLVPDLFVVCCQFLWPMCNSRSNRSGIRLNMQWALGRVAVVANVTSNGDLNKPIDQILSL